MSLFLPDHHDHLINDLVAYPSGEIGPRNEHARINVELAASTDLGVIVIDIFQNVLEADTLGMTHDAHPVHGRKAGVELALRKSNRSSSRVSSSPSTLPGNRFHAPAAH